MAVWRVRKPFLRNFGGESLGEWKGRDSFGRPSGPESLTFSVIARDPIGYEFTRHQRLQLIGAFAMALRSGRFLRQTHGTLVEGTVRGAISYVAQTFRDEGRPNPTRDKDGELG